MKYDLIGDIHGHSEPLARLLDKLGYSKTGGVYRHADREVIFLGDFIDRGPDQRGVLEIAKEALGRLDRHLGEIYERFVARGHIPSNYQ